jgi:hypothetical protein
MAKIERMREEVSTPPSPEYWRRMTESGWKLAAVEWTRDRPSTEPAAPDPSEEIPYGLQIADDCVHLEVNPSEREALLFMVELIVQDRTLTQVAAELNQRGFRTRRGTDWSPPSVFNLLPRMIDVGPRVFSQSEWAARRQRLFRAV